MGKSLNTDSPKLRVMRPQVVHSTPATRGLSRMQVLRIRKSLTEGVRESSIARTEGIPEGAVVRVRLSEMDRADRHLAAVGVAVRGLLDDVSDFHRDIDAAVLAELMEAA